jgi:MOSC domain-containing protein YiiM
MKIVSLAISRKKGTRKKTLGQAVVRMDHGLEGDAHAGPWHRQVSLLAAESIGKACRQGLDVTFGDFAENIATEGIMPREGVFARVIAGGEIHCEDTIEIVDL